MLSVVCQRLEGTGGQINITVIVNDTVYWPDLDKTTAAPVTIEPQTRLELHNVFIVYLLPPVSVLWICSFTRLSRIIDKY